MNPILSDSFVNTFATDAATELALRQATNQLPVSPSLAGRFASTVARAIHRTIDPRGFALAEAANVTLPALTTTKLAPIVSLQPRQPEVAELDLAA